MIEDLQMLEKLRILIQNDQSLQLISTYPIKDDLLICFLRARKFDLNRAFQSLKNYLNMASNYPELLTNLRESQLRAQFNKRLQVVYKGRDRSGRRLFIFRAGRWNPQETSLDDIFRCNVYCLQRLATYTDAQINGIVAIVDLGNIGLHQARQFTPGHAKKVANLLTHAFPIRFQSIHIVNQNWLVSLLMSVISPLLPTKMQQRIHYHGNCWSSLHEHFDASDLPEDYGGLRQQLDLSYWADSDALDASKDAQDLFELKLNIVP